MTDYGGVTHIYEPVNSHVAHADDDEDEGNYELQVRAIISLFTYKNHRDKLIASFTCFLNY